MLIDLHYLTVKYKLDIQRILHVGAHHCEERKVYPEVPVVWIDAIPDIVETWEEKFKGDPLNSIYLAVVSDKVEKVKFNYANNGASSSILELGTHEQNHPNIHFVKSEARLALPLDLITAGLGDFNFLNLDIQGAELKALKGFDEGLKNIDYIYTEINTEQVYVDCCTVDELDNYLSDFQRVETKMTSKGWGDAFYIRKTLL